MARTKKIKPLGQVDALGFEITTCPRCGGSGQYSYCSMYGTSCFRCAGKGKAYTKRGLAAANMYNASLKVRADEIKVGDTIVNRFGKFEKVISSNLTGEGNHTYWRIVLNSSIEGYLSDTMVRKGWKPEDKQAKLKAAQDYQSTL